VWLFNVFSGAPLGMWPSYLEDSYVALPTEKPPCLAFSLAYLFQGEVSVTKSGYDTSWALKDMRYAVCQELISAIGYPSAHLECGYTPADALSTRHCVAPIDLFPAGYAPLGRSRLTMFQHIMQESTLSFVAL